VARGGLLETPEAGNGERWGAGRAIKQRSWKRWEAAVAGRGPPGLSSGVRDLDVLTRPYSDLGCVLSGQLRRPRLGGDGGRIPGRPPTWVWGGWCMEGDVLRGVPGPSVLHRTELMALNFLNVWEAGPLSLVLLRAGNKCLK
jgi:hypothetical protein